MSKSAKAAVAAARGELTRSIASSRRAIHALRQQQTLVTLVFGMLDHLLGKHASYPYIYVDGQRPVVRFGVYDMPGFKDPVLERVHGFLLGLFPETSTNDYPEGLTRDYEYSGPEMMVRFTVNVSAESETCRRVEIGRETVERVKYKIQCD